MLIKSLLKKEEGSVVLILMVTMFVILGIVAFVVDFGRVYAEKSHLQRAANSAVLSGGQSLPSEPDEAIDVATNILSENATHDLNNIQLENENHRIEAVVNKNVTMSFARILGIDTVDVQVHSAAVIESITKAKGVAPVGVNRDWYKTLDRSQSYVLKLSNPDIGYTGVLSMGHLPGADWYNEYLMHGYPEFIEAGDRFDTEHGVVTGKTRDAIQYRMDGCPEPPNSYDNYSRDCTRVMLLPVYDPIYESGTLKEVVIVGFALFYIEDLTSDNKGIVGKFINGVWPNSYGSETQEDFGAYALRLSF
ncbi:MAG: Tad domain-containing protein [Bacillaceae bacterium]|nr:Tad domain-containing protein [Bacillaceae bacterium]